MSLAGHSTLLEQAFPLQRTLDAVPDSRVGIVHRQQKLGLFRDVPEVLDQFGAGMACPQVGFFLFVPAALDHVRQDGLKFLAVHCFILSHVPLLC
jgi:hypothetical protein